ncbi:MAG: DUF4357 domain-containing protein [Erysipelotrichaceae bacterium]|nr:DUF4357 domain-containing protein [Erysipelotrichaceae bacterium]
MAKGIIYIMTTVVPGLIKIGKTGKENYEQRMYNLERNGYSNVVGLKRHFAIEVDDYDEKEQLLDDIFSKSRLENTELFALDVNLAVQLLSSFEGKQIYPENISKDEVFDEASAKRDVYLIPEGTYYLERRIKRWNNQTVKGTMTVQDGKCTVLKGSVLCPLKGEGNVERIEKERNKANVINNVLQEDVEFNSPSMAACFIINGPANGWNEWRTKDGKAIDVFRNN